MAASDASAGTTTAEPTRAGRGARRRGLLAGMRIRRKLIVLHTVFSLALAGILVLALRPATAEVVRQAEEHEAGLALGLLLAERAAGRAAPGTETDALRRALGPDAQVRFGAPGAVGIGAEAAERARTLGGRVAAIGPRGETIVASYEGATGQFVGVSVTLVGARAVVVRLYLILSIALLAVYGLVAAALEVFVLPQHVYGPIRRMLEADRAVQEGRRGQELIPASAMPADELGAIMLSRNESIRALRRHESDLSEALAQLEEVATDLKRKNHLLETAQRNLADAERLASFGMMSAGIAHELNTPLTVLKGLVERIGRGSQGARRAGAPADNGGVSPEEAALMLRVVGRLERLSKGLLDIARARPPVSESTPIRPLVEEAWTLVRLDRGAAAVEFDVRIPDGLSAWCDGERVVQVLVNLLRNAVDAMDGAKSGAGGRADGAGGTSRIEVAGGSYEREGRRWTWLTISDTGPGISAELLSRLFQPFVSSRLDSKGTGLGLAVAEGIIRAHGGVILARNRGGGGAVFEIVLPAGSAGERAVGRP